MRKLLALIVFVVIPGLGLLWFKGAIGPVDAESPFKMTIQIPEGASTSQIADILVREEAIKSAFAMKIYAKMHGAQSALQAGNFVVSQTMSLSEILDVLMHGKSAQNRITIPEGYTLADIDALIAEKGLCDAGCFMASANATDWADVQTVDFLPKASGLAPRGAGIEGYLFPDTYSYDPANFDAHGLIVNMLNGFRKKANDFYDEVQASGRSLHDIVTMASLIEEEAISDDERPVIAGILWKRYDEGMGLGVDAAVRYIQNKPTGALTVSDLNVDSPYNLRKFRGLPPGPIANPGLKSIEAALNPQDSRYWYYLHDPKGQIHYAVTNEEHNINKAEHLN